MAEGRVVGIDLGTTNSLVAYMQGDKPVVIPGVDGSNLVPSVVALDPIAAEGGRPTVTVGNSARRALIETPERVIYSVKRLMGRGLAEVKKELQFFPFRLADDVRRRRSAAGATRGDELYAAGDLRVRSASAHAQCGTLLPAGRSRKRSSLFRRTSTTRSGKPRRTPAAWRVSKCCVW